MCQLWIEFQWYDMVQVIHLDIYFLFSYGSLLFNHQELVINFRFVSSDWHKFSIVIVVVFFIVLSLLRIGLSGFSVCLLLSLLFVGGVFLRRVLFEKSQDWNGASHSVSWPVYMCVWVACQFWQNVKYAIFFFPCRSKNESVVGYGITTCHCK